MSLVHDWQKVRDCGNGVSLHFSCQSSMVRVVVSQKDGELSQDVGPFDVTGIGNVAERLRSGHMQFNADATRMIRNVVASLGLLGRKLG